MSLNKMGAAPAPEKMDIAAITKDLPKIDMKAVKDIIEDDDMMPKLDTMNK